MLCLGLGFWAVLDLGLWVLAFGFRVVAFGFWMLGFGFWGGLKAPGSPEAPWRAFGGPRDQGLSRLLEVLWGSGRAQ